MLSPLWVSYDKTRRASPLPFILACGAAHGLAGGHFNLGSKLGFELAEKPLINLLRRFSRPIADTACILYTRRHIRTVPFPFCPAATGHLFAPLSPLSWKERSGSITAMLPLLPSAPYLDRIRFALHHFLKASQKNILSLSEMRCLGTRLAERIGLPRKARTSLDEGLFGKKAKPTKSRE